MRFLGGEVPLQGVGCWVLGVRCRVFGVGCLVHAPRSITFGLGLEVPLCLPLRTYRRPASRERELFIDNLLVQIYIISEIIWWTGLAPWEFEFPFPGYLTSGSR